MPVGPPPTHSPVTGRPIRPGSRYLHASSSHFRDTAGRTVLLRGINLSASAKTPAGQPNAKLDGFWETAKSGEVSFVGRVLELENGVADEHLARLKSWGFNCLRYVITWESIEHEGPGKYDQEYIDYTVALLRKCKEYGFYVYMDPHQDLWSRFSGGSGAPYWTLIACGLDPEKFTVTNAATLECEWPGADRSTPSPAEYPDMIWATNYQRLACQTLFTLWNAGREFAPKCVIDGVNIQDYLQDHFLAAISLLGRAIHDAGDLEDDCVIGWDSLNEPNAGLLGIENLDQHGKESILRIGPTPTAFQAMRLGMGSAVEVERYRMGSLGPKRDGSVLVDPQGVRAWLDADAEADGSPYGWTRGPDWELGTCVWGLHGVWDPETDELLEPDYFNRTPGAPSRPVDFGADYWLPHWRRYGPVIREFHKDAILFIQTPVFQIPPIIKGPEILRRVVHSNHFYDGLTLVTKHWNWFNADALGILRGKYGSVVLGVKVGEAAIRKCLREQLGMLRQDTFDAVGNVPTMMGEIGIPFDLDKKKAYSDGDYSAHTRALDASLNACDGTNALNYTIWTYCPDNSHQWGDLWNGEDLSVWSADDAVRMAFHRASNSHIDLVGKIPTKRSRAISRASSTSSGRSSVYGSRLSTPNGSSARLGMSPVSVMSSLPSLSSPTGMTPVLELPNPFTASAGTLPGRGYDDTPLNFNDGSRAITAFCRPYPMRTVGTPLDINFDIRSSVFSMTVRVEPGDVKDPDLSTDIFIPLVHYAAFPSRTCHGTPNNFGSSQVSLASLAKSYPSEKSPYLSATYQSSYQASALSLPEIGAEDPHALALRVSVSIGRFETEGEILRWYYPRPTSGSMIVKIEVQRQNGAIPTWVSQAGAREEVEFEQSRWRKSIRALRRPGLRRDVALATSVSLGTVALALLLVL